MSPAEDSSTQSDSALKKAMTAVTAKKNRRLVIGGLIIVAILAAVLVSTLRGDGNDSEPSSAPSTPVEVTVEPSTPATEDDEPSGSDKEKDKSSSSESSEPNVITEVPEETETQAPSSEEVMDPADYPPGAPANRGGLPEEFPLVDSFVYTGMEEEPNRVIINGTVDDATQAILTLDANLLDNYRVDFRQVDDGRNAGRYDVDGPFLPAGTQVIVKADGSFQVRVPQE